MRENDKDDIMPKLRTHQSTLESVIGDGGRAVSGLLHVRPGAVNGGGGGAGGQAGHHARALAGDRVQVNNVQLRHANNILSLRLTSVKS